METDIDEKNIPRSIRYELLDNYRQGKNTRYTRTLSR